MENAILLVDDDNSVRSVYGAFIQKAGFHVHMAESYTEALNIISSVNFDLIITDIHLGDNNGLNLVKEVHARELDTYILVITGYPDFQTVQEALRFGAFDYLSKPIRREDLILAIHRAMDHKAMRDERTRLRRDLQAIFRSVKDAIITVDTQLNILAVNQAADRLCQLNHQQVSQPMTTENNNNCIHHCREAVLKVLKTSNTVELTRISCEHADGSPLMINVTVSPLVDESDHTMGAVLVIRDETRIAALERDLNARRQFHRIVGQSATMQRIYGLIEDLSRVESTVLIHGESGTGKELVAEALHYESARRDNPLVKINCAALTDTLLESELFGHVRGAFTGAHQDKLGRFELADKGTIFLDEIGDISPQMQTRLLRVLQEREFERVGDTRTRQVDVRVVAATNVNLKERVEQKKFREDLYYRLKVVVIPLPPLRQRRDDIPLLINHFINRFNTLFNKEINGVTEQVLKTFMNNNWPGNIREIQHVIEHAFVVCHQPVIDMDHLPPEFRDSPIFQPVQTAHNPLSTTYDQDAKLPNSTDQQSGPAHQLSEKEQIVIALNQTGWVKARAARLLGFSRSTMYRKMRSYNLEDAPESW
ncbi:MAG: sigma 54-interacting transcriptional regulator [Magnetococcales bacterium]|nr:sigma 54-interacting transcriptional regulator [Magnetococcales bacterium]